MAIPISIETLLNENVVEWARIEFKENWNPETTLKTISAFANDIDNWGGGYIVLGANEKDGKVVRPVKGIEPGSIDKIQKESYDLTKSRMKRLDFKPFFEYLLSFSSVLLLFHRDC